MTLHESNREIINLLAEGKTIKEVAAEKKMKPRTVKDRLEKLRLQNDCRTNTQLILKLLGFEPKKTEKR